MSADQILAELSAAGLERWECHRALDKANNELAGLLAKAIECPDLTMTRAVVAAGVKRSYGYKLVRERAARST